MRKNINKNNDMKRAVSRKCRKFSWKQFIFTFVVLAFIALTQSQIMGAFFQIQALTQEWFYFLSIALFWGIIALLYVLYQKRQVQRNFGKPLQTLCEATKKVAEGDFSVRLETVHLPNEYDYMDMTYQNFNKMVQELSSIETLKTSFIADVSHELKTPLAVIQNYGTILQNSNLSEQERMECADTIVDATKKLTTLITNILKLNKLENQNIPTKIETFDLCGQLSECVFMFTEQLGNKKIQFEAEIDDFCMITSDKDMLLIVWQNLFSNAIKFSNTEGKILLKQSQTKDNVTVSITDTGCGMDTETLKHIFDKFYQGDTSHSSEGNGLGLALCAKVLNLLQGKIEVKSKLREGTTFTITLVK